MHHQIDHHQHIDHNPSSESTDIFSSSNSTKEAWESQVQNIIYKIYIQQKASNQSPKSPSSYKAELLQERREVLADNLWQQLRKEFGISMAGTINQLYTNERLISYIIHYLMGLPLTENSKKIIRTIVEYFDPTRTFLKSLVQILVTNLQKQEESELNKLSVILHTLNILFNQQSPENYKFNSYIYMYGGDGINLKEKARWPFEKSGTLCFWYNMSEQTKECKLFEIVNGQKIGYEIVLRNKKIYFQKIKEQKGFSLIRNDSAFLCEGLVNTDVKLWIQFQIKKKYFQKALFINVIMNNFVLNNVEVDYFNPTSNDFSMSFFKNFHGKISSVLVFTSNLAKQVQNLGAKQGFTYENDIKNFSYMFQNELSNVYLLYTSIRSKTYFKNVQTKEEEGLQQSKKQSQFGKSPMKTILFDAINRRNGQIGPEACKYHNISIHKKEMQLYGGLHAYVGFFDLLKFYAKDASSNMKVYTQCLCDLFNLFKNIFESKATSIEQADNMDLFRIMSNFFIETEMIGFTEQLVPKLKELYVSLNNRCTKQKFFKKFFWGIPAGEFLQLQQLQYYLKLIKGIYTQQIQNSLNIFNVKDILYFLLDRYDEVNCCFQHKRTNSIAHKKKIKNYQTVLAKYFGIIEQIIEMKIMDNTDNQQLVSIVQQITYCFALNASPCFVQALVRFLSDIFTKNQAVEKLFIAQFQNNKESKMSLFTALANSYSWRTKGNLIELILHIYGVRMFKEGGQKDLMALCLKYPTLTSRFSSIKSQDIDKSMDMSQDKNSLNSTNVRSFMAMRPICLEEIVLLSDEEIVKIIWQWGTSQEIMQSKLQDNENPATLILMDIYNGSVYKVRKLISHLLLTNINQIVFTPDLMAWVIQCLLIIQTDSQNIRNSDQLLLKIIQQTKENLLKLISYYRVSANQDEQESLQNQLDIIKLILISVKSKYSPQISNYHKLIYLEISQQFLRSFYEQIKTSKFQEEEFFIEKTKYILSNCYKSLLQYFISIGNQDYQFQQESSMEENQRQLTVILAIIEKIYDIIIYLTSTRQQILLLDEVNSKRNQLIFELIFPQQGKGSQIQLFCFIFVCLQGLFDNFDDVTNENNQAKIISKKKMILTLIKKYLKFMIQISQNSGSLKLQKFQETLKNIFLNTLGFLQSKFYQYHFGQGIQFQNGLKNIQDIKNLIVNIFTQLIELMKYIQECSCSKHKSFYELMKPKKKHKHINNIKNIFPLIWKKVDDKILEFMSLSNQTLRKEDARNKLEEHLKMKRLYSFTKSIEKTITKKMNNFLQQEKKDNEVTEKKSVHTYIRNQSEKYKILAQFQENIALFMYQSSNKQKNEEQNRRIDSEVIKRNLRHSLDKIWNKNRLYEGFWTNPEFYTYSQNKQTFLYDNTLKKYYRKVRSDRQTKYLLTPIISIEARELYPQQKASFDEQIYFTDLADEDEKILTQRRKSQKYLQVGFQFLKKKVYQKIKKSANLIKQVSHQQSQQQKVEQFIVKEVLFIQPMKARYCTLKIDNNALELFFKSSHSIQHISLLKNKQKPNDRLSQKWLLSQIQTYQLKKYMLKQNSIQIFFKEGNSILLSFYGKSEQFFVKFIEMLQKYKRIDINIEKIPYALKLFDPFKSNDKYFITEQWVKRQISTFKYLMSLNILSGRSNSDLNQFFIFPWVLSDYKSSKFKKDQPKYRDLQKTMGGLGNTQRIQKFVQIKNAIEQNHKDEFLHSHYFGFHYSNLPIVLQYLIRVSPFAQGAMQLQGGKFDIPDRLFTSVCDSFKNAITEMSDVRELIPQFYYFPQFLINFNDFQFGVQQNLKKVDNVQLPDGYANAYDFIEAHREQLQSEQVSQNLHKWLDLVFGYKQYGKESQSSFNKFHYLSYENNVSSIFQEDKIQNRESIQSQIVYFGKVPTQLFSKPHPKRNSIHSNSISQYTMAYNRTNPFINEKSNLLESDKIIHEQGIFSTLNKSCIHFRFSQSNKRFLILRRDGKGIIFQNDKSDKNRNLNIGSVLHFQIFLDKFEQVYIFDESAELSEFPIFSLWGEHLFMGGLWGGKILKYDIITKEFQMHSKHSDTVTAISGNEQLQMIVSGTINGQLIIWQYHSKSHILYSIPYIHSTRKLIYKQKMVVHSKRINSIQLNTDLRVAMVCGQDAQVSIVDLQRLQLIRVIKLQQRVRNALLITHPYYMIFICCQNNRQFCYSLNGQYLDESNYEDLHKDIRICVINGYQERVVIKKKGQECFSILKLPELRQQTTIPIKVQDNQVLNYQITTQNDDIQILFTTETHLVYCNSTIQPNKSRNGKKSN